MVNTSFFSSAFLPLIKQLVTSLYLTVLFFNYFLYLVRDKLTQIVALLLRKDTKKVCCSLDEVKGVNIVDLSVIKKKLRNNEYPSLEAFEVTIHFYQLSSIQNIMKNKRNQTQQDDLKLMQRLVIKIHGRKSVEASIASSLLSLANNKIAGVRKNLTVTHPPPKACCKLINLPALFGIS